MIFFRSLSAAFSSQGEEVVEGEREEIACILGRQLFWCPWNQVIWRRGTMTGRASHYLRRPVRLLTALENRGEHGTGASSQSLFFRK